MKNNIVWILFVFAFCVHSKIQAQFIDRTVQLGQNISFISNEIKGADIAHVTSNKGFTGILSANPKTGEIRITNAGSVGTYKITVTKFAIVTKTDYKDCLEFDVPPPNPNFLEDCIKRTQSLKKIAAYTFNLTVKPFCGGSGEFDIFSTITMPRAVKSIVIGDLDNDGNQDILTTYNPDLDVYNNGNLTDPKAGGATISYGDGSGKFTVQKEIKASGLFPSYSSIADFNGDGFQDITTSHVDPIGHAETRLGNGNRDGLNSLLPNHSTTPTGFGARMVKAGDFNNDGIPDLAIISKDAGEIYNPFIFNTFFAGRGATLIIALGDGLGNFNQTINLQPLIDAYQDPSPSTLFDLSIPNISQIIIAQDPTDMELVDYNHDGNLDVVVTHGNDKTSRIYYGYGNGKFEEGAIRYPSIFSSTRIIEPYTKEYKDLFATPIDFNYDNVFGPVDMYSYSQNKKNFGLILNNKFYNLNVEAPRSFTLGYFNSDTIPDIAIASRDAIYISFGYLLQDGKNIDFATPQIYLKRSLVEIVANVNGDFKGIVTGEFNNDGILDLAITKKESTEVIILLGKKLHSEFSMFKTDGFYPDEQVSINDTLKWTINSKPFERTFKFKNTGDEKLFLKSLTLDSSVSTKNFTISSIPRYPDNGDSAILTKGQEKEFKIYFNPIDNIKQANVLLKAEDPCGKIVDFTFTIQINTIEGPQLGDYPETTISIGDNPSIAPNGKPINAIGVTAKSDIDFADGIMVNPETGIVTIINAKNTGTYTITINAFDGNGFFISKKCKINVLKSSCTDGEFLPGPSSDFSTIAAISDYNIRVYEDYTTVTIKNQVLGDFNNDGNQDILTFIEKNKGGVKNYYTGLFLGNKTGLFSYKETAYSSRSIYGNIYLKIADFNGDGNLDYAILWSELRIYLGDGQGNFNKRFELSGISLLDASDLVVGDFNGDGRPDFSIILGPNPPQKFVVYIGDGRGNFSKKVDLKSNRSYTSFFRFCNTITKLNTKKEAKDEIIIIDDIGELYRYKSGGLEKTNFNRVNENYSYTTVTGDFNNDGNVDLLIKNNNLLKVYLLDSEGNLLNYIESNVISNDIVNLSVFDYNSDGFQDIIFNDSKFINYIYTGKGDGTFISQKSFFGKNAIIGDFNGDNVFDVLISEEPKYSSSYPGGFGSGIIATTTTYSVKAMLGKSPFSITDEDGNINIDLGNTCLGNTVTKTFYIKNQSKGDIVIQGASIIGENKELFTLSNISFPLTLVEGDSISFELTFNPVTEGLKKSRLEIYSENCLASSSAYNIQGEATPLIALSKGFYPDVTIFSGSNTTIAPTTPIFLGNDYTVSSKSNFSGILTFDSTGKVYITNALQKGSYKINYGRCNSYESSFVLSVVDPLCSQGIMNEAEPILFNSSFPSGKPAFVRFGDFNNDGNQDLIFANAGNIPGTGYPFLTIIYGDGKGGILQRNDIIVGTKYLYLDRIPPLNLISFLISDFNNDGYQDILVGHEGAITLLTNKQNGQFSQNQISINEGSNFGNYYAPIILNQANLGDFNNDGIKELVISNNDINGTILIFNINRNGRLKLKKELHIGTPITHITTADFNTDGNIDLAYVNEQNKSLTLLLGKGDYTFEAGTVLTVNEAPSYLVQRDFNNDTITDLVTLNSTTGIVSVRLGDGKGGFVNAPDINTGSAAISISAGDFNGDGNQDIVIGTQNNDNIVFYLGNGTGQFYKHRSISGFSGTSIAVGDFNKDHYQDIVVTNPWSNYISLFTGKKIEAGTIELTGNKVIIAPGDASPSVEDHTDFGFALANKKITRTFTIQNKDSLVQIFEKGSFNFSGQHASLFSVDDSLFPLSIEKGKSARFDVTFSPLSDLGKKEAILTIKNQLCQAEYNYFSFSIAGTVYDPPVLGHYDDTTINIGGNVILKPSSIPGDKTSMFAYTDKEFSGNLAVDPVTGNLSISNAKNAGTYIVKVIAIDKNNASIETTFNLTVLDPHCAAPNFMEGYFDTRIGSQFCIGDFNEDGNQDVLLQIQAIIYFLEGNGRGNFSRALSLQSDIGSAFLQDIKTADINGDGHLDIVYTTKEVTSHIAIYFGKGDGTFIKSQSIQVNDIRDFYIADINKDGRQEIVFLTKHQINVWKDNGVGNFTLTSFSIPETYGSFNNNLRGALSFTLGDINNDNYVDFTIATSQGLLIYVGDIYGEFYFYKKLDSIIGSKIIKGGDFNKDDNDDLAILKDNVFSIVYGDGSGNYLNPINFSTGLSGDLLIGFDLGDLNGDGYLDFIIADTQIKLVLSDGSGGYSIQTKELEGNYSDPSLKDVLIGNFNNDNLLDIVSSSKFAKYPFSVLLSTPNIIVKSKFGLNEFVFNNRFLSPISENKTDFGDQCLFKKSIDHAFVIENKTNAVINLNTDAIVLSGANADMFTLGGISFPTTINVGESKEFKIAFTPTSIGAKNAVVSIFYGDICGNEYSFSIAGNGSDNGTPSLGNYADVSILAGGNMQIRPNQAPDNLTNLIAYVANPNFSGVITINPETGILNLSNVTIAGEYRVYVKGYSCSGDISTSFKLTVTDPECSNAYFVTSNNLPSFAYSNQQIADLNKDGILDFVELKVDATFISINVFKGDITGQYVKSNLRFDIRVFSGLSSFHIVDFNKDGNLDLVIPIRLNGKDAFLPLLGDGTGSFSKTNLTLTTFNFSGGEYKVGDFNNDGVQDLISGRLNNDSILILLSDESLNYATTILPASGAFNILELGDFNNDENQDLIVQTTLSQLKLLLGDGALGFTDANTFSIKGNVVQMVKGDFNNDRFQDLAIVSFERNITGVGSYYLSILLGNGNGIFEQKTPIEFFNTPITRLVYADFNGDHKGDLGYTLTLQDGTNYFVILSDNGSGVLVETQRFQIPATRSDSQASIADLNNDGKIDVFLSSSMNLSLLLLNQGAEIKLTGNGKEISNGNTTTSIDDFTNFGTSIAPIEKTFSIENIGTAPLALGTGAISFSGVNAQNFAISGIAFPLSVAPNSKTTFKVLFTPTGFGESNATIHIANSDCNESDYSFAIKSTVADIEPPVFKQIQISDTYYTDPGKNFATIILDIQATDNLTANPKITGNTSANNQYPLGLSILKFTAQDDAGNSTDIEIILNVVDNEPPVLQCPTNLSIGVSALSNSSNFGQPIATDNTFNVSISYVDVSTQGNSGCTFVNYDISRKYTAVDNYNNSIGCNQLITVFDDIVPQVRTKDFNIYMNATGVASITTADIDAGSSDDCDITMVLDKTTFNCSNFGPNLVKLSVTDANGNTSSENAVVYLLDSLPPTVITKDINIFLDTNGVATVKAEEFDNGSFDNCAFTRILLDRTNFNCEDLGVNTVNLQVLDIGLNKVSVSASVTVIDTISPKVKTKDISVYLDENGVANVKTSDIDDGSIDNCQIERFVLDKSSFSCLNLGKNGIQFTVFDKSGNSASAPAIVTVIDTIPPKILANRSVILFLDSLGTATLSASQIDQGITDNCGIASITIDKDSFNCSNAGENIVFLTVTDRSGNISKEYIQVTVLKSVFPTSITGTTSICVGSTTALSNATPSGVWSSSTPAVATVNETGIVTGITAGTAQISYTYIDGNSCVSTVTKFVTINALPVVASITGTTSVCVGSTTALSNATALGVWSSATPAVATVSATGVVTGITAGTSVISYTVTNRNGCITAVSTTITVNALPVVANITGNASVCLGSTTTLANATASGVWSSGTAAVASVSATGVVTALSAGTSVISYTVTNSNGCVTVVSTTITVNALPVVAAITGTTSVCIGSTTTLANATASGVWSSGTAAVAAVSATGVVTGISSGTSVISYTVTNSNGCVTAVTTTITVNALPVVASITGNASVCVGSTTTLANATASGVWSSATPGVATVSATGVVTAVSSGTSVISYTVTNSNGCVTVVSTTITVNALPVVASITGATSVCVGSTTTLANATASGVWSSGTPSVAAVSATGVVYAISSGSSVISYRVTNTSGCSTTVSQAITAFAIPSAPVVSAQTYCEGDPTNVLTASGSTGNTLTWYGTTATGGTGTSTAPKPSSAIPGTLNYYVSQINPSTGCESLRANLSVTVYPTPVKATITRDATGTLVSNFTNGNQWYLNGIIMVGETLKNLKPVQSGKYSIILTQNECRSPMSDIYYYMRISIPTLSSNEYLRLYPNPVASTLRIDFILNNYRQVDLKIYDMTGRLITERKKLLNGSEINLTGLITGMYSYQVLDQDGKILYSDMFIKD